MPDHAEGRASPWDALGAASTGLSLVGLLASRVRLRFTRRGERNRSGHREQDKQSQEVRFGVGT